MNFKDVRTFQAFLKEYGMDSGKSSYGSNKSVMAPSASPSKKPSASPTTAKATKSPTITGPAKKDQPEILAVRATDVPADAVVKNIKNEPMGKVVSRVGDKPKADALVVDTGKMGKQKYQVLPKDQKVFIDNPDYQEESAATKLLSKLKVKSKKVRSIKKILRNSKFNEQREVVFEINFNDPKLAKAALDLPIKCGFEAETSWDSVQGGTDDDGDWMEGMTWSEVSDLVYDQEGSRSVNRIEENYREWLMETDYFYDAESAVIGELVDERKEDESYLDDYVSSRVSESDIEAYREDKLADLESAKDEGDEDAAAEYEEREDWDMDAWGREYVEENEQESFEEWLADEIRDNGEHWDDAWERAMEACDIDQYMYDEHGSWYDLLRSEDIYLYNEDGDGGGLDEVATGLEDWASNNSQSNDVRPGDYHSGAGVDNTYWRVESDSSIQTEGTGAEIISPVYDTPRKMLEEMKSLFSWLEEQDVDTNSSTGIHVTMSYAGTQGEGPGFKGFTNDLKVNPVKLAVLLGDKYLLSTFGRENNSYAKSQYKTLEKLGNKLKANPDAKTIEQIENILSDGISRDKFSSINFKDQKDGNTGNQLIEFRIGGGSDYHRDFNKVAKAVIRYATTMQAAYSNKLYNQDYAKALYRLIANVGKISADAEDRVKDRINPDVEAPAVDVLKDYFSKDNYVEHLRYLVAAYNTLAEYQQLKNQQNEDVETDGPDADRLQSLLKKAQKHFAGAVAQAGYDYNQGHNRATPNAKSIGILRSALKDFELDYDTLSSLINAHQSRIDTGDRRSDLTPKVILGRIKNGVDKLFKKSVVQEPEYLSANQVERLITGMWNAIQSDEITDSQEAIKFANLIAGASGRSPDFTAGWVDEVRSQSAYREFKEFHAKVVRGRYGEGALFSAGEPVDSKKLKALTDYLKQYPEWNHPVAKGHNPNITGDDSYIDNALSKMMIKMRSRWEHLEDIRRDNPGLYIDSMREIALLVARLIDANKTNDDMMSDKHKELLGTAHANHRDGAQYFGMGIRTAEDLKELIKSIEQPNTRMFSDRPVAHELRDIIQNYLRSTYGRYYEMKDREGDGFYRLGPVPEIIKQRTDAIKEFLTGFDKVAQKLGFDSQSSEIANKKQLDQKQADFKKKHGPEYVGTIDAFSFGGDIFVSKNLMNSLDDVEDIALAKATRFSSSMHKSDTRDILVIPSAHYFTALDAQEVSQNSRYKNTWREPLAKQLLAKFESLYGIDFESLSQHYANINDGRIKRELQTRKVNITDKLGDGRVGVGQFAPLLPKEQLEGPHGEPFSPSAATAWKVNNPELAKKADADDTKATGLPSHLRGLNDFGKARVNFREFDYMMQNGINEYVKDSEKQELVAFLNDNEVDTATKHRMLKIMIDNVDQQLKEPLGISYALVKAQSQRENMNTFDKFDKLPLAEQLRILAKVDKKKIDEAWSKKYKDSINCSNPKGFSQKAHCDSKKKTNEDDMFGRHLLRRGAYKAALEALTGVLDRKGKSRRHSVVYYAARIAQSYEGVDARELAKMYAAQVNEAKKKSLKNPKDNPCWDGYKPVGTKKKNGKTVPNCVPETIEAEQDMAALLTAYGTPKKKKKKKVKEGAVPDNRKVRILNKLMSKPLLASDIGAQMEAFFAVPDPLMVNEFRKQRAMAGDEVDLRPILKGFINTLLHPELKQQVNISESTLIEAKGIMGRVAGDKFVKGEEQLEFQGVVVYPEDSEQFETPEQRDAAIAEFEKQTGAKIEWTNTPNKGTLAFGVATLTDPLNNDNPSYWGRYFRAKMVDMMGSWGNNQVPAGWKLQKAGAMKLDIGIDPQHLIKSEQLHSSIDDIVRTVAANSQGHQMQGELIGGLEQIKSGQNPVFEGDIQHLPALRDYFGEIMGPCALMAGMVKGQAEDANRDLLKGAGWDKCKVFWPQAMNYALVDSVFIGPNGEEVGVSSKGGKGARASAKNIADAINKAPDKMVRKYVTTVNIIKIVEASSALDAPFKLAEMLGILPAKLEAEVKGYIKSGKTDYVGLSNEAKELFNYGTPRQDVPGFNTGYALVALLAKKVAKAVNEKPDFSEGCIAFLNQSSIVQLYCKMGKSGNDARVTGWDAVYPPNFQGRVVLDGSKNYYSSRIGGKFAFGFV